jgi:zinc protease
MKPILVTDHTAGYVFFELVFQTGSVSDPPGLEGVAYHMASSLSLGTRRRSRAEFLDELDYLGASLDVAVFRESIVVEGEVITRNLEPFVALIGEMLTEPSFDSDELERSKRLTLAELEQVIDNDQSLCSIFHSRFLWRDHPYGRPGKGTRASVPRITRDDVVRAYERHITRPNLLVGAAGDIEADTLDDLLHRHLAGLSDRPAEPQHIDVAAPTPGLRVLLVDKADRNQTQVAWGQPTIHASHPDFFPLYVANTAFGGTFTARLMHEIREKRGWSYGAYSRLSVDRRTGVLSVRYYPASKDTLPALELGRSLLRDFAGQGLTEGEVEFSQSYLANAYPFRVETASKRLSQLIEVELLGHPPNYLDGYVEAVRAVSTAQANAAARAHVTPEDQALTVVCTAKEFERELRGWDGVTEVRVQPYDAEWPEDLAGA